VLNKQAAFGSLSKRRFDEKFSREFFIISVILHDETAFL